MKIDWSQSSTKRGLVWVVAALIGIPMVLIGKDVSQLLILAAAVAGGLGVALNN
jgi:hypothetical protein